METLSKDFKGYCDSKKQDSELCNWWPLSSLTLLSPRYDCQALEG